VVDPDKGLTENEEEHAKRDSQFGSNYKPPPARTPFCTFFIAAMDDFMLKILLVCAVISIVIDMSFAEKGHRKLGTYLS
jgi:magnesium-transporting ATPase (P-type)